ncbi:hypothetical protein ACQB6R_05070 [Propionibacteriaceae bacterium G1746]|uniref:hypothetical protein n=1 Tax=Aestuariimicrobium sp. G57 TaxID=3418485 RepID=UPI003C1D8FFF
MCNPLTPRPDRWRLITDPEGTGPRVPGWPFRRHLVHVAETCHLPWRAAALAAGLTWQAGGRIARVRRDAGAIPTMDAAAVLALSPGTLEGVLRRPVQAPHAPHMVRALLAAGFTVPRLAQYLCRSEAEVAGLAGGSAHAGTTVRTELLLATALLSAGLVCPLAGAQAHPPRPSRRVAA